MGNIFSRKRQFIATQSQWNTKNPILASGEIGIEAEYTSGKITKVRLKSGDGVSTWNTLPFMEDPTVSLVGRTNNYADLDGKPTIPNFTGLHSELDLDDGTNPHGTTKEDVGLPDVDNTRDLDKPISIPQLVEFNKKANISDLGPVAFTNDFLSLDNIPPSFDQITEHSALNLDDGPNPHGATASTFNLGNVDNTADADKEVSGPQQQALDLKLNIDQVINDFNTDPNNPELAAGANTVYQILQNPALSGIKNFKIIGDETYTILEEDKDSYLIFNSLTGATITLPDALPNGLTFWAETKTAQDFIFVAEGTLESKFGGTVSVAFEHLKFAKTGNTDWSGGLLTSEGIVGDVFTSEDIVANVDVPQLGVKKGEVIPTGTNITQALQALLIDANPELFITIVGATLEVDATHANKILVFEADCTVTLPDSADFQFTAYLKSDNTTVTFNAETTLNSAYGNTLTLQHTTAHFAKESSTEWLGVFPNLAEGNSVDVEQVRSQSTTSVPSSKLLDDELDLKLEESDIDTIGKLSAISTSIGQQIGYVGATYIANNPNPVDFGFFENEDSFFLINRTLEISNTTHNIEIENLLNRGTIRFYITKTTADDVTLTFSSPTQTVTYLNENVLKGDLNSIHLVELFGTNTTELGFSVRFTPLTVGSGNGDIETRIPKIGIDKIISDPTYTVLETDSVRRLIFTNPCTVTLPSALPKGFQFEVRKDTAGDITFTAEGTFNSIEGNVLTGDAGIHAYIYKDDATTWVGVLPGDGGGVVSETAPFIEVFTYTTGAQTFTLNESPDFVARVTRNGQVLQNPSIDYSVATNVLTVNETLLENDEIGILYFTNVGNLVNAGGSTSWGDITGTLADQTDLQNELDQTVKLTGAQTINDNKQFTGITTFTNDINRQIGGTTVSGLGASNGGGTLKLKESTDDPNTSSTDVGQLYLLDGELHYRFEGGGNGTQVSNIIPTEINRSVKTGFGDTLLASDVNVLENANYTSEVVIKAHGAGHSLFNSISQEGSNYTISLSNSTAIPQTNGENGVSCIKGSVSIVDTITLANSITFHFEFSYIFEEGQLPTQIGSTILTKRGTGSGTASITFSSSSPQLSITGLSSGDIKKISTMWEVNDARY